MHLTHINLSKRVQHARQQAGYTIVELSIAVAIAGVLLVSAIGLVQNVLLTNRANETVSILARTVAQIDKTWAGQPDYDGLTLATVGATGAFAGMQIARTAGVVTGVTSRFNRPVFANELADVPGAGLNRGFGITFAGVPTAVCSDLVASAASAGVRGILVTPEANVNATSQEVAASIPTSMDADGAFVVPDGTVSVMDATRATPNLEAALGVDACGTQNATVALTFVNWK